MLIQPKLLFVVNNPSFLVSHRLHLLQAARDRGYQVHVACPLGKEVALIEENHCIHHTWNVSRKGVNPLKELLAIRGLYRIYKKVQPDLIHHLTIKPIIYGGIAARFAKAPALVNAVTGLGAVYISNSLKAKWLRKLTNKGYSVSAKHPNNQFIFQNDDDKNLFINNGLALRENTQIIPGSGVCMQQYSALALPDPGSLVIVLVGRMLKDKGVVEFVQAARSLQHKKRRFILVGDIDPGNPASLKRLQIESWVNEGVIEWWGHQENMLEVYRQSHIVCLPSYREGSPRALIEAAACARPIITTDAPGCRDLVDVGKNGLLVPVRDSSALTKAIERMIQIPARLESLGKASRQLVEKKYAKEIVNQQTLDIYQTLCETE